MKKLLIILPGFLFEVRVSGCWIILILLAFAGCSAPEAKDTTTIQPVDTGDYFQDKVVVKYATHFDVTYHNNYKIVRTNASLGGEEEHNGILVLLQKGTAAPELKGELASAYIIEVPVNSVAVNAQPAECFLRELGLVDSIVAIGGVVSYNDDMRRKALDREVGQVGYSWHSPPNVEVLLDRKADLFLMTLANPDHSVAIGKCRQLGIATAPVYDWAEDHYMAVAEWIKYYSLFFNAEKEANRVFDEITQRIEKIKTAVGETKEKPTAQWSFYTGNNRWHIRLTSVESQFLQDAGLTNPLADVIASNADGVNSVSTEELMVKAKDIDHWIVGDIHSAALPPENFMSSFKAWREGKIYHNMRRSKPEVNASDWYGTATVRPDYVLADLVKLVHPELLPDHELMFMGVLDKSIEFPVLKSMK